MRFPTAFLFRFLEQQLDEHVLNAIVAPTIADLQYEAESAQDPWRRRLAIVRGYLALGRVLLLHGPLWRLVMRTVLTIVVLGGIGAAVLVGAFTVTTLGPAQISPFFLMMVVTPLVLRYVGSGRSRREMFLNCMGVGSVMSIAFLGWFAFVRNPAHAGWRAYMPSLFFLLGCVASASWMIATVAADPSDTAARVHRRKLLDLLASAAVFGFCYSLVGGWHHYRGFYGAPGVFNTVSWGMFLASFFGLVAVAVYLPVMSLTRRVVPRTRGVVAVIGALLFPVPMLAFPALQGRLEPLAVFRGDPLALAPMALPYVLAGAALGWLIASHRVESAAS